MPNQVFVIQWDNAKWDHSATAGVISFQIRLYQTSNTIQFIYNSLSGTYSSGAGGASVGITGSTTGTGNFLSVNQMNTSTTVSSTTETKTLSTKPASGLTFTFSPPANRKDWIGSGAGGSGTDFNNAANWAPAGVPVSTDNLYMDIDDFGTSSNPFATLSTATNITSLTINFTGASPTIKRTFNLNTGNKTFNITSNLSLNNYSIQSGGGSGSTPGHTLNFNIETGSTTTIGSTINDELSMKNASTSGSLYLTNISVASGATLTDNGKFTALVQNGTTGACKISLTNSGTVNINGTTTANSISAAGVIAFNTDNSGSTFFNGNAYFDDGLSNTTTSTTIGIGATTAGQSGKVIFKGSLVYFGTRGICSPSGFNQTIFDGPSLTIQSVSIGSNLQVFFPLLTIGNPGSNSPIVTLGGTGNAQIGTPSGLSINNTSTLNLVAHTLNVAGGTAGALAIASGATLKCGGSDDGLALGTLSLNNFPKKFSTYSLLTNSIVEYSGTSDQTIVNLPYEKLTLSGSSVKSLLANTTANKVLNISGANTKLKLSDYVITANGGFTGSGKIVANTSSDLNPKSGIIANGPATLTFDGTSNFLKVLTVNTGTITLANALNIAAGTETVTSGTGDYGTVIVNGTLAAGDYLTLKSSSGDVSARVAQSSGNITGNVTFERYIPAKRAWRFLSVPFSSSSQSINQAWQEGQVNPDIYTQMNEFEGFGTDITYDGSIANGFDPNTTVNPSIKVWNPATTTWSTSIPPTISTSITAYKAYCLFVRGSRAVNLSQGTGAIVDATVLRAKGNLYQGNFSVPINSTTMPGVLPGSWIFVGNPYPSSIDLTSVLSNPATLGIIDNKFYIWDASIDGAYTVGGYKVYNYGTTAPQNLKADIPSTASGIIQSGQAFMVITDPAASTFGLKFSETDKTAIAPEEKKVFGPPAQLVPAQVAAPLPRAYINLEDVSGDSSILIDGVATIFRSDFSTAVNSDDAIKIFSNGSGNPNETISLYRNGRNIAIEALPIPDSTSSSGTRVRDTIFLRPNHLSPKDYYIKILPKFMPTMFASAKLIDQYLDSIVAIPKNGITSYRFSANSDTNSYTNRFVIIFGFTVASGSSQTIPDSSSLFAKTKLIEPNGSGISIFPNPATEKNVQLKFTKMLQGSYAINIFNEQGTKFFETEINYTGGVGNYPLRFNKALPAGVYKVNIINKSTKKASNLSLFISK